MCGIAGIINPPDIAPDPARLRAMAAALVHRGPDDEGIWSHAGIGFVHRRLAILGLGAAGHQPMVHADGRWTICYNGEIFNHRQLRARLPDIQWRGTSDTESLLHGIATRGWQILPELNGFFAFAAHDAATGKVYLARDRFGVKPLHYTRIGDGWAFASEVGALIAAGYRCRLNQPVFHHALVNYWTFGDEHCLAGIRTLLPGRMLTVDPATGSIDESDWAPVHAPFDADLRARLAAMRRDERLDLLDTTMQQAVERRMLSEVPAATLCSGGIDSSLVTAMLARLHPDVEAFTMHHTEQPEWDESHYAELVCAKAGIKLTHVPMTAGRWRDSYVDIACRFGTPLWYESSIAGIELAAAVANSGCKVLLGGEGADELFGGYDGKFPAERDAFISEAGQPPPIQTSDESCWPMEVELWRVFGGQVAPASESTYRKYMLDGCRRAVAHLPPARAEMTAINAVETRWHLYRALRQLDAWSMRWSVEAREPFLDLDLVRLCFNYPLEGLFWPSIKGDLKEVARRWLPAEVVDRPRKLGFSFDSNPFFVAHARPEFLENSMLRDLYQIKKPRPLTKWLEPGRGRGAFRVCSAEIWLRHYLGGQSVESIERELWR